MGCLYNANIHRKPSCAAKLTHLIDNLKSKNNGLVWDEVRWHGSLRSSNPRHLGVLREYHNSIRNEEDSSMNITVIRRISRFLSCALQPTECNPRFKCFNAWQTVRHWNCSPLVYQGCLGRTKKDHCYSAHLVLPPSSPRHLVALGHQNCHIGMEFHLKFGVVEACRRTS